MTKAFTPPPLPAGKKLVVRWKDEFDSGATVDATKWGHHYGDGMDFGMPEPGWGNKERQCYTDDPSNIKIDPATKTLVITAKNGGTCVNKKNNTPGTSKSPVTSAKIVSKTQFMWKGEAGSSSPILVSARMKVPLTTISFPAFWLLPMDPTKPWCSGCGKYGGWCTSGEIDIMEHIGKDNDIHSTIHFGGSDSETTWVDCKNKSGHVTLPPGNGPDMWHTYSLLWDAGSIKTYVDGQLILDAKVNDSTKDWFTAKAMGNKLAPFDNPMNIIINLAVGGVWVEGYPKDGPQPPMPVIPDTDMAKYSLEVDYVVVHDVVDA